MFKSDKIYLANTFKLQPQPSHDEDLLSFIFISWCLSGWCFHLINPKYSKTKLLSPLLVNNTDRQTEFEHLVGNIFSHVITLTLTVIQSFVWVWRSLLTNPLPLPPPPPPRLLLIRLWWLWQLVLCSTHAVKVIYCSFIHVWCSLLDIRLWLLSP